MDLGLIGLIGRTAIVCASSQGLGRACAEALAAGGLAEMTDELFDGGSYAGVI